MNTPHEKSIAYYVVCPPGVEPWIVRELADLGVAISQGGVGKGGIECVGSIADLYRVNLCSRLASRVLLRVGHFKAIHFKDLVQRTSELPWSHWLQPGRAVCVRASSHSSTLYHQGAIAERVTEAIGLSLGSAPQAGTLDKFGDPVDGAALVVARIHKDRCHISIDTSGDHLHRRGYRLAQGKAPLRENLAAALIAMSEWDQRAPFVDPFCGSGTLPIEAAMMAARIAPGAHRRFAFMDFADFDATLWAHTVDEQASKRAAGVNERAMPTIMGSDRDAGVVEAAKANAHRAGVADAVEFTHAAISSISFPGDRRGWVVTNPPYGGRIGGANDLRNLYAAFGNRLLKDARGWMLCLPSSNKVLCGHIGLKLDLTAHISNGGIPLAIVRGKVPS